MMEGGEVARAGLGVFSVRLVRASCCESAGFAIFSLHMKIFLFGVMAGLCATPVAAQLAEPSHVVVLHAARMLDVAGGRVVAPGEMLVKGDRIVAAEGGLSDDHLVEHHSE